MLSEIQRYDENLIPGSVTPARGDRTGALVTVDGHGRYCETVYQANVWNLNTTSSGIAVNSTNVFNAATSKPILGLWNPPQSKKIAAINRVTLMINSGTSGANGFVWAFIPPTCNVTSTGENAEINAATLHIGGSPFKTFINSQMLGAGNAQILRLLGGVGVGLVVAGINQTFTEECASDIFCPPGAAIGIFPVLAGTSLSVFASIVYEAIPY